MSSPHLSLIIPAHNEADYLPRLLDSVDAARERFAHGPEAVEIVVANNASTDATVEVARTRRCTVVEVEKRVIAAARNAGARVAQGSVLAFIDADSQIHPETFNAIDRALATGRVVAGATGVKLERMSLGIALTYAVMIPMVWVTGMDTGVVFCRKEDFEAIGGYNEEVMFGEDVELLVDMRRLGRPRHQRLARLTSVKAIASARKWDQHGEWHYLALLLRFPFWYLLSSRSLDEFARKYWYEDDR